MALEDFGQFRLVHPNKLDTAEDFLQVLRDDATAELYKNDLDMIESNFARAINSLHILQGKLEAIESELHAGFKASLDG